MTRKVTFQLVADAFTGAKACDRATLGRIAFWCEHLGDKPVTEITAHDIDAALVALATRGKLKAGVGFEAIETGEPLAVSTVNRYIGQAGTIFKWARTKRLVDRDFRSPTLGIEREEELADPERYLRPEEVERLLKVAPAIDNRWHKMRALIVVLYHTGLRVGSLMSVRGMDVDLKARTMAVPKLTKNKAPIVCALSTDAVAALKSLPRVAPDELVFGSHAGKPFKYTKLFKRVALEARLPGRTIHWLRHGHGFMLAKSGVSQAMIMHSMGHKTLKAAGRYSHANVSDKLHVINSVFG